MLPRLLKVIAGLAAAAALGFAIYHFRLWERDWSTIDDGWASLIGSAMGSFLAVVGALYVSKAEERRKKKEFEEFVKVAVQNLVVQASYLEAMAREPHKIASTLDVQAGIISIQLRNLIDAVSVFDREISHSTNGSYDLRRKIITLDAMLAEPRAAFNLDQPPQHLIPAWYAGAYQVRCHATTVLDAFGWIAPIPTADLIATKVENVTRAWKSWNNIPADNSTFPLDRRST